MKKVLGLDIGTTSIGWAIINAADERKINPVTSQEPDTDINNERTDIHQGTDGDYAVGVRIIQAQEMQQRFDEGKKLNDGEKRTPTAERRKYRGSRRTKGRYKLRRDKLMRVLKALNMLPEGATFRAQNPAWQPKNEERKWLDVRENSAFYTNAEGKRGKGNDIGEALYELRDRAAREAIKADEWGRLMLHFNQWRGYSSDRFATEEKPKFDYYTAEVIQFDDKVFTPIYDAKEKERLKYNKYPITVRTTDPINIGSNETEEILREFSGYLFLPKVDFKQGDFITIKKPERSEEKKGKVVLETFFSIKPTRPDPEDWNYRYQTLQKNLEEWNATGGTVGSYFYQNFYQQKNPDLARIRTSIVNRDWYEQEFDQIFDVQYEVNKATFEATGIEAIVRTAFKSQDVLAEVKKKDGLKEQLRFLIKDKIIYFQRPWQQSKNKARCRFEKVPLIREQRDKATGETKKVLSHEGRTVVPRSHPLHQEFKIWQQINNVKLWHHSAGEKHELMSDEALCKEALSRTPAEIKEALYEALQQSKSKSWRTYVNETFGLNVKVQGDDEKKGRRQMDEPQAYSVNYIKRSKKGVEQDNPLKGNTTKHMVLQIVGKDDSWFAAPHAKLDAKRQANAADTEKARTSSGLISNIQVLWEVIYDIAVSDPKLVKENIQKHFPEFTLDQCNQLSHVKFDDGGMASLSAKAIRQMLPLMRAGKYWDACAITKKGADKIASLLELNKAEVNEDEKLASLKDMLSDKSTREHLAEFKATDDFKGLSYWEAAAVIYGSHSKSKVAKASVLRPLAPHSMNNPVVEKIVNETMALVNELKLRYGFDEIRIELSRELKASRDEREQMWEGMTAGAQKTEWAKRMLRELKEEELYTSSDLEPSSKSNLDKIRIIEDVVKFKTGKEYDLKAKEYNLSEPTGNDVRRYLMWLEQNFRCPYTEQMIPLTDVFSRQNLVEIEHIIPKERYYDNSYANKVITWKEVNTLKDNKTAYEFIVSKRPSTDSIKLASGKTVMLVSAGEWEKHVEGMFPKGRKRMNLTRREIPEDPITRQLKETQYINKKLKEELSKILPTGKEVWVTTGGVTDLLRESWHMNEVMKELMRDRFEHFEVTTGKKNFEIRNLVYKKNLINKKTGELKEMEVFPGYSKRQDHRHHALDAIIIACTRQSHIQYINALNAASDADQGSDEKKKQKYHSLKAQLCRGNSKTKFKTPWEERLFMPAVKAALESLIVSHKNTKLLISPSANHKAAGQRHPASLRGELHKDTNYAKRNYFQGDKLPLSKVIERILTAGMENQNQTMVFPRSFAQLIKGIVFKEKYQDILIPLLAPYEKEPLNKTSIKTIGKAILDRIAADKLLFDAKSAAPFTTLTVFSEKNTSVRPMGGSINLNDEEKIGKIADPHLRRIAGYRLSYVKAQKVAADKMGLDKKDKDKLRAEIDRIPLYSNAVYEVRIQRDGKEPEWIELSQLTPALLNKIAYAKPDSTRKVREALTGRIQKHGGDYAAAFSDYFTEPIIPSGRPMPVITARQLHFFQDLYEITPGRYVYSQDTFMAYVFERRQKDEGGKKKDREAVFLKFIDAIRALEDRGPGKISYDRLVPAEDKDAFSLAFTLSKNDLVYIPERKLTSDELAEIDWENHANISPKLYRVKSIPGSLNKVVFQKHTIALGISLNEADAKAVLKNQELKAQEEDVEMGSPDTLQHCVKVFTDKLGKKIVPYWHFPNGSWDKGIAEKIGLTVSIDSIKA